MDKYVCDVCGYVYDPAVGDPDNGGKRFPTPGSALSAEPARTSSPNSNRAGSGDAGGISFSLSHTLVFPVIF